MQRAIPVFVLAVVALIASCPAGVVDAAPNQACVVNPNGVPNINDTDADWLLDSCEPGAGATVGSADTDGDGVKDGMEYWAGTNINGGSGYPDGIDTDGDGCLNEAEKGSDPSSGGGRHPGNWWDFYELNGTNDIDLADTLITLQYFGQPSGNGPVQHRISRQSLNQFPNGFTVERDTGIDLGHALLSLRQFGAICSTPPGPAPADGGGIFD